MKEVTATGSIGTPVLQVTTSANIHNATLTNATLNDVTINAPANFLGTPSFDHATFVGITTNAISLNGIWENPTAEYNLSYDINTRVVSYSPVASGGGGGVQNVIQNTSGSAIFRADEIGSAYIGAALNSYIDLKIGET